MKLFNTTKRWVNWWEKRKIDWKEHYMNPNHPHRILIAEILGHMNWLSLIEVGCAAGANLVQIVKKFPGRQVGGVDVNPEAIAFAETQFKGAVLKVCPADDLSFSDQSVDVLLTDMTMIYISPFLIDKHLTEFKRVSRNWVMFCEFHSDSLWQRLVVKWKDGYNVYNWSKLLEKNGFYDIQKYKIPKECWPESDLQQKYGYIIVARTPKYI